MATEPGKPPFSVPPAAGAIAASAAVPQRAQRSLAPLPPRERYPLGTAALSVLIFVWVGASLGLCFATFAAPQPLLSEFYSKNGLPDATRKALFIALAGCGLLSGLFAAIFLTGRGHRGATTLRRAADVIMPLGLAFLLPSLFSYDPWHREPLTYLVQLAVSVLLLERLLRISLRAIPESVYRYLADKTVLPATATRLLPLLVVVSGALSYAIYFSHYTILNHQRLNTSGYDLGINVNWCFNALNGHPERCTVLFGMDGGHFIGNHAIFGMALWLPFYALKPGAEVLLIFQATIAGLAAIPLYMFASTQLPRWSAVIVAFAYLLFAPLHGPNFYDFHELIPPIFFHFLLYWAIARERTWLVCVLVPVLWSFREDVAVGLTVLGVFLAITGIRPRMGLVLATLSGVWFVLIKFVIMPMYWNTWFANIYKELQAPGASGYGTVVETILINPSYFLTTMLKEVKLIYFLHMFAPLALLPARNPALLLLAIPGFAFSLLTTGYDPTLSIGFQYTCHTIPYLFAASVLMLRVIGRGPDGVIKRRAVLGAIIIGVLSHSYVFGAVLQHNTFVGGFSKVEFTMSTAERERYQTLVRMAASIPQSASVAATENEVPHIAARLNAYTLKDNPVEADYVIVHGARRGLGRTVKNLEQMFTRDKDVYGLVEKKDDIYLFKRGHKSPKTEKAMSDLGIRRKRR